MARTGFFHHVGSFLLLTSTIFMLVATISSPVVNDIALLKVELSNATTSHDTTITFGTFGYCTIDTADGHDVCSPTKLGYNPAAVVSTVVQVEPFDNGAVTSTKDLTKVMVLHPIATGVAFIAFLLAVGAGVIGSFLGAAVSFLAFLIIVIVLITDFVLFHIIKDHVNSVDSGAKASYSVALWLVLVAGICSLLGTFVVFFSCCSARMHRSRDVTHSKADYAAGPRRRRFRYF